MSCTCLAAPADVGAAEGGCKGGGGGGGGVKGGGERVTAVGEQAAAGLTRPTAIHHRHILTHILTDKKILSYYILSNKSFYFCFKKYVVTLNKKFLT